MDAFRFSNAFGSGDLYLGVKGPPNSLDSRLVLTAAYLAPDGEAESYSLREAWEADGGLIVLLGAPVVDPAAMRDALRGLAISPDVRMLWIPNPRAPAGDWVVAGFAMAPGDGSAGVLKADVALPLTADGTGFRLFLPKGTGIDLDETAPGLRLSAGATPPDFARGQYSLPLAESVLIGLGVSSSVGFSFGFEMPGGEQLAKWFDRLDIGMRYSFTTEGGTPDTLRFPVIAGHSLHPGLDVRASLVAGAFEDPSLSSFDAQVAGGGDTVFLSTFRTVDGREIRLEAEAMRFTLAARPAPNSGRQTLTLSGDFGLSVGPQARTAEAALVLTDEAGFACGTSGTEVVVLPAGATDLRLALVPGMPAHVAGSGDEAALTPASRTAWVRLSAPQDLAYYAQPEGQAALFDATNPVGSEAVPILKYLPLRAGTLPAADPPVLPLVPLAGVAAADLDRAITLEATALAPARKQRISGTQQALLREGPPAGLFSPGTTLAEGELTAITPRGLEAGFSSASGAADGGEQWDYVQLARLHPPNAGQLRLGGTGGITEPLLSALLTNQQCLVVSEPDAIRPYFSEPGDTDLSLAGWEFRLNPETWASRGTIMILKNAEAPLKDLAADPGAWAEARAFNRNPEAESKALMAIIEAAEAEVDAARAAAKTDPRSTARSDFEYFVDVVVRSPEWNGLLFLNAELGALPPGLDGLRAGIDEAGFFGHHIGVTQTLFRSLDDLRNRETSMFGLIRYADAGKPFGRSGDYDFRVDDLGVLFRDSQIRDFRSTLSIYLGSLFGAAPSMKGAAAPIVQMTGSRQRRGDAETYLFSTEADSLFTLRQGALAEVEFIQGAFETISADSAPGGETVARFSFAGDLTFRDISEDGDEVGFDLFSFDALAFSDLRIDMHFATDKPQAPSFAFDIQHMVPDEALSQARRGSLFEGFPVTLGRFLTGGKDGPGAQGYMSVVLPETPARLSAPWFGVSLQLDMGSLTEVAGAAGLEAALSLAWSPADGQYAVGLLLPGSSSASTELSVLGVLKLRIYALSMRRSEGAWALLLNGITLGVFGKTLPPGGSFDFYLFGNPDPDGSAGSLGWYGAYLAKEEEKKDDNRTAEAVPEPDLPPPLPNT